MITTTKQLNAATDSLRWAINSYKSAVDSELENELPGIVRHLGQIDLLLTEKIRKGTNLSVIQVAQSCASEARGIVLSHSEETVTRSKASHAKRVTRATWETDHSEWVPSEMTTYRLDLNHLTIIAVGDDGVETDLNAEGEPCLSLSDLCDYVVQLAEEGLKVSALLYPVLSLSNAPKRR